jgi:isopenicillin N synthase-like dioxygenase
MQSIPLIDISSLRTKDSDAFLKTVHEIDHACRNIGFFYITGHGISPTQMKSMFTLSQQFFAQSEQVKHKILITNSKNHRGWGTTGAEQLNPDKPQDWKETFDMALDIHPEHPIVEACPRLYGPNQYGELEGFQQQMNQHYGLLMSVTKQVLKAMAIALKQPEDFFNQYLVDHISVLRLLHYPPRPENKNLKGNSKAAGAHTDYGCITLLAQDDIGGLEVRNAEGEWISAPPIKDAIVVNIGDLMQRWTNDQYRSTAHRVASPPSDRHRYSMPFFVEPKFDTEVRCIDSCVLEGEQPKYDMITSGDWIISRFDATYAYRTKNGE